MKKITICGRAKNLEIINKLADALKEAGFYVFSFPFAKDVFKNDLPQLAYNLMCSGATYDHFEKIKKGDYILFANFGSDAGNSMTLELGFATALSKHIIALNHDQELARECLFTDILETENINEIVSKLLKLI